VAHRKAQKAVGEYKVSRGIGHEFYMGSGGYACLNYPLETLFLSLLSRFCNGSCVEVHGARFVVCSSSLGQPQSEESWARAEVCYSLTFSNIFF
jgi:hypothetical protein